jgi:hypothetical protein
MSRHFRPSKIDEVQPLPLSVQDYMLEKRLAKIREAKAGLETEANAAAKEETRRQAEE